MALMENDVSVILAPETDARCRHCGGPVSLITLTCKECGKTAEEAEKEEHAAK